MVLETWNGGRHRPVCARHVFLLIPWVGITYWVAGGSPAALSGIAFMLALFAYQGSQRRPLATGGQGTALVVVVQWRTVEVNRHRRLAGHEETGVLIEHRSAEPVCLPRSPPTL